MLIICYFVEFNQSINDNEDDNDDHNQNYKTNLKEFADNTGELIKEKYYTLLDHLDQRIKQQKTTMIIDEDLELTSQNKLRGVYAGIVQTDESDANFVKIICVTTGTKCIDGELMSMSGNSINDW